MNTSQTPNRKSRSSRAIVPTSTTASPFATQKEFKAAIKAIREAFNANPMLSKGELIGGLLHRFGLANGHVPESPTPEMVAVVSAYLTTNEPEISPLGVIADLALARLQIKVLQAKLEDAEESAEYARKEAKDWSFLARVSTREVCEWEAGRMLKRHEN